jgi:lysophospholipase L1-like esterase
MLGINDVGHYSVNQMDQLMEKWEIVIDRIQAKTPHVEICIQSLIPVWTGGETKDVNNEVVRAYNEALKELAKEKGCVFIDVAAYFVDSTGGLADPYTNDKYVHTNAAGVDTWVKVLKACTAYGD